MVHKSSFKISHSDWGLIPYLDAFDKQSVLVEAIRNGEAPEQIIFCSHPPVVTLGRGTLPGDVFGWRGETHSVNRGGRATYHGPNQLIMYPLIYIGRSKPGFVKKKIKENDLHAYMRALELSVSDVLENYKITSQRQSLQKQIGEDQEKEATGVWIDNKKIAAVGVSVKAWVTSHGVAFNLWNDSAAFEGINPCGFRRDQVTTLELVLGRKVPREEVLDLWAEAICERLFE